MSDRTNESQRRNSETWDRLNGESRNGETAHRAPRTEKDKMIACWRNFKVQAALSRCSHDEVFIKTRINLLLGIVTYLINRTPIKRNWQKGSKQKNRSKTGIL